MCLLFTSYTIASIRRSENDLNSFFSIFMQTLKWRSSCLNFGYVCQGTWTIWTLDDSGLVNSDLIFFSFGQFGPQKVRSELTKSQMVFRSEVNKGQMDLRSELTNA